jgi:cystathionine beta-lyase
MDAQQETAGKLAEWFAGHPLIKRVHYPGLAEHPGRDIHSSQSEGSGCVLSFTLTDRVQTRKFLKTVKVPILAVSLGGVESILSYPATMSHASMIRECREGLDVCDSLVRLSVGLEAFADLKEGLDRALQESVAE